MAFPHISKVWGFVLSIPCIALYYLVFYAYNAYVGSTPNLDQWSTRIFIAGAVMHMMLYLRNGGWLTFGSKRTQLFWSDGVCFAPNLLHFTIQAFDFAVLWGVQVEDEYTQERNEIDVVINPLLATTRYNVQMSHIASVVDRSVTAFLLWLFFGWKKGQGHLAMMRFGFRMMAVAYIMVTISSLVDHGRRQTERGVAAVGSVLQEGIVAVGESLKAPQKEQQKVKVTVQLSRGFEPVMPQEDLFELSSSDEYVYDNDVDAFGRKYYRSKKPDKEGRSFFLVNEAVCIAIPAGMKIHFIADRPPTYAVNMKPTVKIVKRAHSFTFENWKTLLLKEKRLGLFLVTNEPWSYINEEWEAVSSKHFVVAESKDAHQLSEGQKGGLVCF